MDFPLGESKSNFTRKILSFSNDGRLLPFGEKLPQKRAMSVPPKKKLKLYANYQTMFSDTRPRNQLKVKTNNETPTAVPAEKAQLKSVEDMKRLMEVQGSHRSLFYRQPSRNHLSSYSTVVVDLEAVRGSGKKVTFKPGTGSLGLVEMSRREKPSVVITLPVKSEKKTTKGTQTDYRESEAQTLAWRHEIIAEEKVYAELMSFESLGLERNFPPGLEEVTLIEKARQKLAWENVIAKLRGKENESKRKFLVVGLAASEESFRDQKLEKVNQERMRISVTQMKEARERSEESLRRRLERSYGRRRAENDLKIDYWHHQLTRQLRKMKSSREEAAAKTKKRSIVALYTDKTSELYAPNLRDGENPSRGHEMIDIRCRYLKRFHGLSKLEKHLENTLQPTFLKVNYGEPSGAKKLCSRKYREKAIEVPEEEMFSGSLSLKVPVPAPSPDSPAVPALGL